MAQIPPSFLETQRGTDGGPNLGFYHQRCTKFTDNSLFEEHKNYIKLEKVKLIKSLGDTVITPIDSSWFEFYDKEGKEIVTLEYY